jgi:hypothetical protein
MASIAEILIGQADQTIKSTGQQTSLSDSISKGVQNYAQIANIALEKEKLVLLKQKAAKEQEDVSSAKMEKFVEALSKGANYQGPARTNYYQKWLPKYRDSLGLTQDFPDDSLKFATATPENLSRIQTLVANVQSGKMSRQDAIATLNNPTQFADVPPDVIESTYKEFDEAAKTNIQAQAQTAQRLQSAAQFQQGQTAQELQALDARGVQLNDRVQKDIGKVADARKELKTTIKQFADYRSAVAAGKPANSTAAAQGFFKAAKAAQGAGVLTDKDLENLTGQRGLLDRGEEFFRSWIVGGYADKKLKMMEDAIKYGMKQADTQIKTKAAAIEPLFDSARSPGEREALRRASGIDVYLNEVQPEKKAPAANVEQAQALYDKYKNDPEKKKILLEKARAAGIKIKE